MGSYGVFGLHWCIEFLIGVVLWSRMDRIRPRGFVSNIHLGRPLGPPYL